MNKNVIFYFTGTGNSLKVSKDIAKEIGNCDVIPMSAYKEKEISSDYESVGFVFPVYAGGPPAYVQKFVANKDFSLNKSAYYYAVATYGAFQGNSLYMINEILKRKNILLNAGFGVRMFRNYVIAYDMPSNVEKHQMRSQKKINIIAQKIKQRINTALPKKSRKLFEKINQSTAEYPTMDKDYTISDDCFSCGLCKKVCPVDNIEMLDGKPVFKHNCEQCMACIHACPKRAINYKDKTQNRGRYINPDIADIQFMNNVPAIF